jgi:hypothetical protein
MEKRRDGVDGDFLWASVSHLEDRISTVDTKANILIGIAIAIVAVVGSLAKAVLDTYIPPVLRISVGVGAGATLVVASGVVLLSLRLLNPRKSSPEHSQGFMYPKPYVLWPRSGQPWSSSAQAHVKALQTLTESDMLANLEAMQTTLIFLVQAKYRHYRRAVEWTRRLVVLSLAANTVAIFAMFS